MKALVIGCGSIGVRHIEHLRRLGVESVEAADPSPQARERARTRLGMTVQSDPQEALNRRPDVVLVCTPAATHIPLTIQALGAGAHVFVEKPLSIGFEGIDQLLEKAGSDGRIVQVGYQLRYHPAMLAAQEIVRQGRLGKILTAHAEFGLYLQKWWPGRDYRSSYMAQDDESGGLLLDVSHEIDLMIWFLGRIEEVTAFGGRVSRLEISGMDTVKILLISSDGAVASIHMDCLQPTYTRGLALVGEGTALRWSCPSGRADTSLGHLEICDSNMDRFETVPLQGRAEDTYVEELRDFLDAIRAKKAPAVGIRHGIEVLKVVDAIQKSMQGHCAVRVGS